MINVLIHTDTRYPVDRKIIRKATQDTLIKHKVESLDCEISVVVVGARKMKQLTSDFLQDDKKHQILTFALNEESQPKTLMGEDLSRIGESQGFVNPPDAILRLGDIVLCWPQVLLEASKDDIMVDDEVYVLICHGVEHLLGYNHAE